MRFLFYDVETSGLNPAFDQILTFACIGTDPQLNELFREEVCIRLRPDIVPSPGAFLTHCLTPEVLASGIPEYEAAVKLHALFNTPGTVSIGYNSLGFDDEFLRFLFFRNLLDPYSHQYAKGCGRMDMLPVAALYRIFCPDVLSWPLLDNGRPTLKLEFLSRENQFQTSGRAHEAMADVEALVSLARKFSRDPEVWSYVQGFFDKNMEPKRILSLRDEIRVGNEGGMVGLMVSASFGPEANYIAPVLHLGSSVPYKNQSLWLRLDRAGLLDEILPETDIYDLFVLRKRPGDQLFLLPALDRFWDKVSSEAKNTYQKNIKQLQQDPARFNKTVAYHRAFRYPEVPDLDADAALYQEGFFSFSEKKEMQRFHERVAAGDLESAAALASPRIQKMAGRILFRNFEGSKTYMSSHLIGVQGEAEGQAVYGYKNDTKLNCRQAMAELREIQKAGGDKLEPVQKEIIGWLEEYIPRLSASFAKPL